MLPSILIGIVGGQRAMTPLAAVAIAAWRGRLPRDSGAPALLGHPLVAGGALALAVAEMAGDKMATAPDRIILPGLAGRAVTSAIAGAALAPRRQRTAAAALGATVALAASYLGWRARMRAIERGGQVATGFAEDALVLAGAVAAVQAAQRASAMRSG